MEMQQLKKRMEDNNFVTYCYSKYLNYHPRILDASMVEDLAHECHVSKHEAYLSLFAAVLGWETDENPQHRALERDYLIPGIHPLDPALYQNDPYCLAVAFPAQKLGKWEMRTSSYAPYEPFVCNHPHLTQDLREIPQIGYFTEEFCFPAILEDGIEWMTVTPNEIETMREPIANSRGNVLTLGLGLGYFAFSAAQKPEVTSVTVVERDASVIELFSTHLLPQFPNREKIRVVEADAFAFLEELEPTAYDTLFADLWHDPSDGLALYLRLKKLEKRRGLQNVDYWIEPSLLSSLRRMVFDKLNDPSAPMRLAGVDPYTLLSNDFLRRLAPDVKRLEKN